MQYFHQDFIEFFQDLAKNNNKEWFHANKKRYEQSVKIPFRAFVADLIAHIQVQNPQLAVLPEECISRINRDVRFSPDKAPYNLHCNAFISEAGGKDKSFPGFFLRFSPEMVGIMGGCFVPSKEQLLALRTGIADNMEQFRALRAEPSFVELFGKIQGESSKRLPASLQEAALQEPLIAHKQFYFVAEREAPLMLQENLMEVLMQYWQAAQPLNAFFKTLLSNQIIYS